MTVNSLFAGKSNQTKNERSTLPFWRAAAILAALAGAMGVGHAQTVAISGLWDTGVNSSDVALGSSTSLQDPHWSLTGSTDPNVQEINAGAWTTTNSAWTDPAGTSTSTWIGPTYSTNGGDAANNGADLSVYVYTLNDFSLPTGSILSTAALSGTLYADNNAEVFLNGTALTLSGTQQSSGGFGEYNYQYGYQTPLSFTTAGSGAAFLASNNVLQIVVANTTASPDPTGLLVTQISGTVQVVPEASALLPMAAALALGAIFWQRSRPKPATLAA